MAEGEPTPKPEKDWSEMTDEERFAEMTGGPESEFGGNYVVNLSGKPKSEKTFTPSHTENAVPSSDRPTKESYRTMEKPRR